MPNRVFPRPPRVSTRSFGLTRSTIMIPGLQDVMGSLPSSPWKSTGYAGNCELTASEAEECKPVPPGPISECSYSKDCSTNSHKPQPQSCRTQKGVPEVAPGHVRMMLGLAPWPLGTLSKSTEGDFLRSGHQGLCISSYWH